VPTVVTLCGVAFRRALPTLTATHHTCPTPRAHRTMDSLLFTTRDVPSPFPAFCWTAGVDGAMWGGNGARRYACLLLGSLPLQPGPYRCQALSAVLRDAGRGGFGQRGFGGDAT